MWEVEVAVLLLHWEPTEGRQPLGNPVSLCSAPSSNLIKIWIIPTHHGIDAPLKFFDEVCGVRKPGCAFELRGRLRACYRIALPNCLRNGWIINARTGEKTNAGETINEPPRGKNAAFISIVWRYSGSHCQSWISAGYRTRGTWSKLFD